MMDYQFKPGDVVTPKEGGPRMVIKGFFGTGHAWCEWFNYKESRLREERIEPAELVLIESNDSKVPVFKPGQEVRLKSGGPLMRVDWVLDNRVVKCTYRNYGEEGARSSADFSEQFYIHCLVKYEQPAPASPVQNQTLASAQEPATTTLKAGDVVRLKSGGPNMVVVSAISSPDRIACQWFSHIKQEFFDLGTHEKALFRLVSPDPATTPPTQ